MEKSVFKEAVISFNGRKNLEMALELDGRDMMVICFLSFCNR